MINATEAGVALRRKQRGVAMGAGTALLLTIAGFAAPALCPAFPAGPPELAGRLSLWASLFALNAIWLVIAIGRVGNHRFAHAEDIDAGVGPAGSDRVRMLQAILQNTLEQSLLAVTAYGAWIMLAPAKWAALPALFAAYFFLGRLLFFAFYAKGAAGRAIGFGLTFYPTVGLTVGAAVFAGRSLLKLAGL